MPIFARLSFFGYLVIPDGEDISSPEIDQGRGGTAALNTGQPISHYSP